MKYIEYNKNLPIANYELFDPVDKIKLPGKYEIIDTPNFFLSRDDYELFRETKSKKNFF